MRKKSTNCFWRLAAETECNERGIMLIDPVEVRATVYGVDDKRDALLIKSEHGEIMVRKADILYLAKDLIELWQVYFGER